MRAHRIPAIAAIGWLASFGCHRDPARGSLPSATEGSRPRAEPPPAALEAGTPGAAAPEPAPRLAPLAAAEPLVPLPVEGFKDAVVSLPLGAVEPRPVVVALHGNFDRPEWQCEVWRGIVRGAFFVLCPRGIPRRDAPKQLDRWEYGSLKQTEQELDAALAALSSRYPDYVDPGPVLFTGFSLGAILGVRIVLGSPAKYPRAVMIEGGERGWTAGAARGYAEKGGQRVLFACAQTHCTQAAKPAARQLERAGVGVRIISAGNVGHTYDAQVAEKIASEWDWLVEGDPRFSRSGP